MEKFSFLSIRQPVWEVELPGGTVLHVQQPTQGQAARIQAMYADIGSLKEKEQGHRVYDAAAVMLSNNEEGITLTGKELNTRYHITDWMLLEFVKQYHAFIEEIKGTKN